MTGYVHSFESLAAVDGAGLRCAVFLGGCPLRCVYCHNPDTQKNDRCRETDAAALVAKIGRYKPYFGKDGGVTFSGGEPLLQADFLSELLPLLKERQIGYWLDTSGAVPLTDSVKKVLNGADGVLLDLKFPDEESYLRYTGRGMEQTLEMLEYLEERGIPTEIRIVTVPGMNDSETLLDAYLPHVKGKKCVKRVRLLGFHTLGFFKYEELGIPNPLEGTPPMDRDRLSALQEYVDRRMLGDENE